MTSFRLHPTVPAHFVVLWLLVLHFPFAYGVCQNCFGAAQGCSGTTATCPWVTTVATNVAAMAAATGGAISVLNVLPHKILRLFPKSILDVLSRVAARDLSVSFDPTDKTTTEIVNAVKFGHFSQVDAVLFFTEAISSIDDDDTEASTKIRKLEAAIKSVESVSHTRGVSTNTNEGCLLYILARLSKSICVNTKGSTSFDLCGDCDTEGAANGSSSGPLSTNKSYSASLTRPKDQNQVGSLFNYFIMVVSTLGLAHVVAITTFLEDVYYEPVRAGENWACCF